MTAPQSWKRAEPVTGYVMGPPEIPRGPATQAVGFNFSVQGDASTELKPNEVAGSPDVSQSNWNNLPGASGTLNRPKDHAANKPAAMTATWSIPAGDNAWRSKTGRDWGFTKSDWNLQKGYIDVGGRLSVTHVPYPKYDVYVYLGAGDNSGKGKVSISSPAGGVDSKGTYFYHLGWLKGKFVRAESTTVESVKDANLVIFPGNTAKEFAIDWAGNLEGGPTGVTGVQIVAVR